MKNTGANADRIDGPAVVTPMHIERPLNDENGKAILGKFGTTLESHFERAIRLGHLLDKAMCTDKESQDREIERALDRRDAGKEFVKAFLARERGSKDCTDMSRGGAAECADGLTVARLDAIKRLRGWELHMGRNDWMLVQRVCGDNYSPAQAVAEISMAYRDSSLARFREALDGLIRGNVESRRCQWCRRGKPHGALLDA